MNHHWHSASDSHVAGGRLALRASEAQAASRRPLGEQSICDHDAIVIRLMSHHWRPLGEQSRGDRDGIMIRLMSRRWPSASDALVAGGRARFWRSRVSERLGALSAALRGEKSRCNHGAIMIRLMSLHWNPAPMKLMSCSLAGSMR